jgi:hypothetical protein
LCEARVPSDQLADDRGTTRVPDEDDGSGAALAAQLLDCRCDGVNHHGRIVVSDPVSERTRGRIAERV